MNFKTLQAIAFGFPFRFSFLEYLILVFSSLFLFNCTPQKNRQPTSIEELKCRGDENLNDYNQHLKEALSFNQDKELSRWYKVENPKAFALVVHGLNLRPLKMEALVKELTAKDIQVLLVALTGHRGSLQEQRELHWEDWIRDLHFHQCLLEKENKKGLPLYSLSFSLGSLVTLGYQIERNYNPFQKQVLIAPAAWVKWYGSIPQYFSFLGRHRGLPSQNLKDYRSQDTTSFAAYEAMAQGRELFDHLQQDSILFQSQALIIMDPKDELVSEKKIQHFILENNQAKRWLYAEVSNKNHLLNKGYHHLIIDKKSLGIEEWKRLQNLLDHFFRSQTSPNP